MGQKLSVYLSTEALETLDKIIQERPPVIGLRVNRSTVISDLIVLEGEAYLATLHLLHEAIKKYIPTPPEAERKPMDPDKHEFGLTTEEYAEKLGVANE